MPASELARSLRILVVDDSPSDVRLIREALKETSVNVTLITARDGVEATDYLQKALLGHFLRPDLIILDLNLPRKSGREVLAEIKTDVRLEADSRDRDDEFERQRRRNLRLQPERK